MELYKKYNVTKVSGETDPDAQYFVLRIDKDHHARVALQAYANSINDTDPDFANELFDWILRHEDMEHTG